jgi:hypothetical protein
MKSMRTEKVLFLMQKLSFAVETPSVAASAVSATVRQDSVRTLLLCAHIAT